MIDIKNVFIKGISSSVPNRIIDNKTYLYEDKNQSFINHTGVKKHYLAEKNSDLNTSDLCYESARKLIKKVGWSRNQIKFLIFVSQTRDYTLPVTACLLQERLKLEKDTIAFDIPLGCSGFVYGLYIAFLISNNTKSNGLLLCGDMSSKMVDPNDKKMLALFGDAGSAIAVEYGSKNKLKSIFSLGSDGKGEKSLILEGNGYGNINNKKNQNDNYLKMNGPKIFEFGLNEIATNISNLFKKNKTKLSEIDYFIFHQANRYLIENIAKKLKISSKKIIYSLDNYGNTNSASIPLTLNKHRLLFKKGKKKILICGFGVGLSWGTAIITINNLTCTNINKI